MWLKLQYNVHPNQLFSWRSHFNQNGHVVFERGKTDVETKLKKKINELENLIGKKEVEVNILKKYLDFYALLDGA